MSTAPSGHADRQVVGERITVALIAKATDDLRKIQERTGLSKTDVVNRALILYEFIDSRLAEGSELTLRNKETGDTETVLLLLCRWPALRGLVRYDTPLRSGRPGVGAA
jgi:hypothetical protein